MAAITTATSGLSSATSTWTGGVVPGAADTVTISHPGTNTFSSTPYLTTGTLASGATSIPVSGGSGSIVAGESIQLEYQTGTDADGYPIYHSAYYKVTTGITGNGTIVIASPGLTIAIPVSGVRVLNCGHVVTLDADHTWGGDTGGGMVINGTLKWPEDASRTLTVRANHVVNSSGTEDRGTSDRQIPLSVQAVLLVNGSASPSGGKYGVTYQGGGRVLHFGGTKKRWTTFTAGVSNGATTFTVADATGWQQGDSLVIFPTASGAPDFRTVATGGVSGNSITITTSITSKSTGAHVVNISSNVTTKPAHGANWPSTITFASTSTGRLHDKRLHQSVWTHDGGNSGYTIPFTVQGSTSASTPVQFRSVDSIFKASNEGGHFVGSWMFGTPGRSSAITVPLKRSILIAGTVSDNSSGGTISGMGGALFDACVIAAVSTNNAAIQQVTGTNVNLPHPCGGVTNSLIYSRLTAFQHGSYIPMTSGVFDGNILIDGLQPSTTYLSAMIYAPGMKFKGNDFAPFGVCNPNTSFNIDPSCGNVQLIGCKYGAANAPFTYGAVPGVLCESWFGTYSTAPTVLVTEAWSNEGYYKSDASLRKNGLSSLKLTNKLSVGGIVRPLVRSLLVQLPANSTRLLLVNLRRSTAGTMPVVTVSGSGIATVVSSVPNDANTWHLATMPIVNSTSVAVQATIAISVDGAVNSDSYVDGLADYPYISSVRWYGYEFDEAAVFRVSDPTITISESTAGALTGIAINHTAQTITLTAARTAAEVYCYCMLDLVNNLDASGNYRTRHITSSDGSSFATTYTVVMGSGGSIAGRYSDANGAVVSAAITGIVAGSRILIKRTDTQAVLANAVVSGTSYSLNVQTASAIPISVTVRKASSSPYYQEWATTGSIDPVGGFAAVANQQPD